MMLLSASTVGSAMLCCLLAFLFSASVAQAWPHSVGTSENEAKEEDLDREYGYATVVTGSRTERRQSDAAVATEVIDRRELRLSGAKDLGEALDGHPGVSIHRGFQGATLQMQGLDPKHVLVLVDGERVAGTLAGAFDLSRLRLEEVERIEIVKGASSALYGTDAMGGVVNLIPRRCTRSEVEVRALGTSLLQADLSASGAIPMSETLCLRLSGGFKHGPQLFLGTEGPASRIDGRDVGNLSGRLEWAPTEQLRFLFSLSGRHADTNGVDASGTGAIYDRHSRAQSFDATIRPEYRFEDGSKLSFSARQSWFGYQTFKDQRFSDQQDSYTKSSSQLWHGTTQYERELGERHALVVGAEGFYEQLESENIASLGERTRFSFFAQDEWKVTDVRRLHLVPGARLDVDLNYGTKFSPRLAVRWEPHSKVVLRASAGMGFRTASFEELLMRFENTGVGYVVEGNPELEPERSRSVQGGVEWKPHDKISITVDGFLNDVDNLITSGTLPGLSDGLIRFGYLNINKARVSGVESGLRLRPLQGLRLDLAYSYWHAMDLTLDRVLEGRPRNRATLRLGWELRKIGLELGATATFIGRRPVFQKLTEEERLEYLPAYGLVDLRVSKTLWRQLSLEAGVENLLDSGDPFSVPIEPRSFYAGVHFRH